VSVQAVFPRATL